MATYDTEAARIKRARMIADALRESGNTPLPPSIRTGGRFDAPVSGWEYANRALQTVLGAYQARQADKDEKKLNEQDKTQLAELMTAVRTAQAPDATEPAPSSDEGPTRVDPSFLPKAERQKQMQAAALRGQQFGGSSAPFANEIVTRELFPPVQQPYTLGPDEQRRGPNNELVAIGMPRTVRESPEDRQLINIVDAKSPKGFKTIKRSDWNGEQLYERPTAGATVSAGLTGNSLDFAAERYRQTGQLPPGLSRSPQATLKIIERAAQLSAELGDTAGEAAMRQQFNKAGQSALAQLTKQQVAVGNYEKTALNSLKIAEELSKKVDRAGVPVADRWIQAGMKSIAGDVDVAKFHTATETFITEYAKIMSGSMGNTPTSDAARQHARELLTTAMTKEQYAGVVETLKQEMEGRIRSFPAQIAELSMQLSGAGTMPGIDPETNKPATMEPPSTDAPVIKEIGGKKYRQIPGTKDWEPL